VNLSEPMRLALVRRLAVNAHTVDALKTRDMISSAQRRTGVLARYDLLLSEQGEGWRTWLQSLGVS
jgi:hypothetical protein